MPLLLRALAGWANLRGQVYRCMRGMRWRFLAGLRLPQNAAVDKGPGSLFTRANAVACRARDSRRHRRLRCSMALPVRRRVVLRHGRSVRRAFHPR